MFALPADGRWLPLRRGVIDLSTGRARTGDVPDLTGLELRLLAYLAERPGTVVGREELERLVLGYAPGTTTRALDAAVRRLRVKVEQDPAKPDHLFTVRASGLRLVLNAPPAPPAPKPAAPSRPFGTFIGRDEEIGRLASAFEGGARLVTVLGPGGVGKSRLVSEYLFRHAPGGGVVRAVVEEGMTASDLQAAVLAGAGAPAGTPLPMLLVLRGGPIVVLDDVEASTLAVAEAVGPWLAAAPGLRVILTSREPIGLLAEVRLPIEALAGDHALGLLRARASEAGMVLRAADDELLRRASAALDGLPLVIELAGVFAAERGLRGLWDWLGNEGPASLADPRSDRELRHRSLTAAIRDSWHRLDCKLQSALLFVAALPHGVDPANLLSDPGTSAADLGALRLLRHRSLVVLDGQADPARYRCLSVVGDAVRRQVGVAEWSAAGEGAAAWLAAFVGRCLGQDGAPLDSVRFGRLAAEGGNLRALLPAARGPHRSVLLLGLSEIAIRRGQREWLVPALEAAAADDPVNRHWLLDRRGRLQRALGRISDSVATYERLLAAAPVEPSAPWEVARIQYAMTLTEAGRADAAEAVLVGILARWPADSIPRYLTLLRLSAPECGSGEKSLASAELALALGERLGIHDAAGELHTYLAIGHARAGRRVRAEQHWSAAELRGTAVEDQPLLARVWMTRAVHALETGELDVALSAIERAEGHYGRIGDVAGLASALSNRAACHLNAGRPAAAAPLFRQAIEVLESLGAGGSAALCRANHASTLVEIGDHGQAEREVRPLLDDPGIPLRVRGMALGALGTAAMDAGDHRRALSVLSEAADASFRSGDLRFQGHFLGLRALAEAWLGVDPAGTLSAARAALDSHDDPQCRGLLIAREAALLGATGGPATEALWRLADGLLARGGSPEDRLAVAILSDPTPGGGAPAQAAHAVVEGRGTPACSSVEVRLALAWRRRRP